MKICAKCKHFCGWCFMSADPKDYYTYYGCGRWAEGRPDPVTGDIDCPTEKLLVCREENPTGECPHWKSKK